MLLIHFLIHLPLGYIDISINDITTTLNSFRSFLCVLSNIQAEFDRTQMYSISAAMKILGSRWLKENITVQVYAHDYSIDWWPNTSVHVSKEKLLCAYIDLHIVVCIVLHNADFKVDTYESPSVSLE